MPRTARDKLPIHITAETRTEARRAKEAERKRIQRLRKATAAAEAARPSTAGESSIAVQDYPRRTSAQVSSPTALASNGGNECYQTDSAIILTQSTPSAAITLTQSTPSGEPAGRAGQARSREELVDAPNLDYAFDVDYAFNIDYDDGFRLDSTHNSPTVSLPVQTEEVDSRQSSLDTPAIPPLLDLPPELGPAVNNGSDALVQVEEQHVAVPPEEEDGFFGANSDIELEIDEQDEPAALEEAGSAMDEEELGDQAARVVDWLLPLLFGRLTSCTAEEHAEEADEHQERRQTSAASGRAHLGLADLRLDPALADVPRGRNGRVSADADISVDVWERTFLGFEKAPAARPEPAQVEDADDSDAGVLSDDGVEADGEEPPQRPSAAEQAAARREEAAADELIETAAKTSPQVCMTCSQPGQLPGLRRVYDVDSVLGYASSLAFAKKGIRFAGVPTAMATFQKSLHLYRNVTWTDDNQRVRRRKVPLHIIPHFCFGTVMGSAHMTVYMFFPGLFHGQEKAGFAMTRADKEEWYDRVFYPALYSDSGVESDLLQHYPASFNAASRAAYARSRETSRLPGQARTQNISHVLVGDYLERLWTGMCTRVSANAELSRFSGAFIFFSDKNLKLEYKKPTLGAAWDLFIARTETYLDFSHVSKADIFVDTANETLADSDEPYVCLWRRCCMESIVKAYCAATQRAVRHGQRAAKTKTHHYTHCLLGEVRSFNLEPALNSPVRRWVAYTQFYHLTKAMFDANKVFPFAHEWLESLSLDPQYYATMMAERSRLERLVLVWKAYGATLERCLEALRLGAAKHFGGRSETRHSWEAMEACRERLDVTAAEEREGGREERADPFWIIPANAYSSFVQYNVSKFSVCFEYLAAPRPNTFISWERSQMMVMLLRSLRACYCDVPLERDWTLWWHRRNHSRKGKERVENPEDDVDNEEGDDFVEAPAQTTHGLALCLTIESGYGWCGDKIDWGQLVFLKPFQKHIAFGNRSMFRAIRFYNSRGMEAVRTEMAEIRRLLALLKRSYRVAASSELVMLTLVDICLQSFRQYIVSSLQRYIPNEVHEQFKDGQYRLDQHFVVELGERVAIQMAAANMQLRTVRELFSLQWSSGTEVRRRGWQAAPFRNYAGMIRSFLQTNVRGGQTMVRRFDSMLFDGVRLTCWVLPHSDKQVFMKTGKAGQGNAMYGKKLFLATTNRVMQHYGRETSTATATWRDLTATVELEQRYVDRPAWAWSLARREEQVLRMLGPRRHPALTLYQSAAAIRAQCREWMRQPGRQVVAFSGQLAEQPRSGALLRAIGSLRQELTVEAAVQRAVLNKEMRTEQGRAAQETLELQQHQHAQQVQQQRWTHLAGRLSWGKMPARQFLQSSEGAVEIPDWYEEQTRYYRLHVDATVGPSRREIERGFGCRVEELQFEKAGRIRQFAVAAGWDVLQGVYPTEGHEVWEGSAEALQKRERAQREKQQQQQQQQQTGGSGSRQTEMAESGSGSGSAATVAESRKRSAAEPEAPWREFDPSWSKKGRMRLNEERRRFIAVRLARGEAWPLQSGKDWSHGQPYEAAAYPTKREVRALFGKAPPRLRYTKAVELEMKMAKAGWDFIDGIYD